MQDELCPRCGEITDGERPDGCEDMLCPVGMRASYTLSVTMLEQIATVERELALRRRVYPRWVDAKRLTKQKADREIAAMEAVLQTLRMMMPR